LRIARRCGEKNEGKRIVNAVTLPLISFTKCGKVPMGAKRKRKHPNSSEQGSVKFEEDGKNN